MRTRRPRDAAYGPFRIVSAHDDMLVEVALMWREHGQPEVRGFVSQFATREGTHVDGFWEALVDAYLEPHTTYDVSPAAV